MRALLVGTALIGLSLVACSENNAPGDEDVADPDDQMDQGPDETDEEDPPTPDESARDYDELAQILGAHVRGEFPVMLAAASISESVMPEGYSLTGDGAGVGAVGSLSFSFNFWCNAGDTAHTVVPCDGTAHHSHFQLVETGSQTVGDMAMDQINRTVDWEIRDLTLDKARFRGADNLALVTSVTTNGEVTAYSLNVDAAYEKVRFMPSAVVPTFGTIDFAINAERTRGDDRRVFETNAQLVYGASGVPTTLTFEGSIQYTVDVETGAVVKL